MPYLTAAMDSSYKLRILLMDVNVAINGEIVIYSMVSLVT